MTGRTIAGLGLLVAGLTAAVVILLWPPSPERCSAVLLDGDPALENPMDLTWADGFLYVADAGNGSVKKLGPDGAVEAEWSGFERPVAVAVAAGGDVLVADFLADEVIVLDSSGAVSDRWGESGSRDGGFDAPSGIAVGPDGDVYVSDFYNHRVQRFGPDGEFLASWGERGIRGGRFRFPTGVAVAPGGRVLVADAFNHRVQVFTAEGEYEDRWGGIGWGIGGGWPGWFRVAKEVAVDPTGYVWVADSFNGRLQRFDAAGSVAGLWDGATGNADSIRYPAGVAVDAQGAAFVTDFFGSGVRKVRCP